MSSRAEPMRDENDCILHWYGLCHDMDDEMYAQDGLRRSEQRYRHLFHHTPVGLWQLDGRPYSAMFQKLRADGVWSDGTPVTADDFVYAFRRLEDPAQFVEVADLLIGDGDLRRHFLLDQLLHDELAAQALLHVVGGELPRVELLLELLACRPNLVLELGLALELSAAEPVPHAARDEDRGGGQQRRPVLDLPHGELVRAVPRGDRTGGPLRIRAQPLNITPFGGRNQRQQRGDDFRRAETLGRARSADDRARR